jgi:photosystem II stability/assembly factor-like uncharacterized protein
MRVALRALVLLLAADAAGAAAPTEPPSPARIEIGRGALLLGVERAGDTVLAAGEHGVLLRSVDAGMQWEMPPSGTLKTLTDVYLASGGEQAWVVGHDEIILHSADAGATWAVQNRAPERDNPLFDVYFTDARNGIAVGGYGVIYRTADGGGTWEREVIKGGDGFEYNFYGVTRAPSGTWFLVGEQGQLLRSRDGARTWEALESPYPGSYFGVVALPYGGVIAYGMLGNAYRTDDDGDTWQRVELPVEQSLLGSRIGKDGRVYLVGRAGILLESADGRTFSNVSAGSRRVHTGVVERPQGGLLVVGERGVRVVE